MEITYSEDQITKVAEQLINEVPNKTLCFYGDMGAGKTTLIKEITKQLGAIGEANSPTFGIVNEYQDANEAVLAYHFDFYRLNDENEALDLGIEDYFSSNTWIFIEWPEIIETLLPSERVNIQLKVVNPNTRKLSFDN
ncbi:tRNA (adenosine(37)-N6)-threonylcarbamoyltransferase complex ATPase subunit type 1 TsaE [Maribacter sp. HTCC2170]|uniref:tRNA (adenosine(37)-N6)-threonylcarbamoyltransferase complex ATPase subunit type 1 TsaE n=1 Tax=Maribacter sp. (strain HTCC2170 / KCCM 42371) TaxID=313603 RepID=UPI00006AFC9B|nr:tRNA (adenosine(37)-N6)-threonylcarbamoyltransferase complex ATPase subunit type 1 TsaE [Maribacter sp. HTCC2170]EAR01214.1 hypothetical protein FB2170_10856 [Maribacter sp. HTCC2170]